MRRALVLVLAWLRVMGAGALYGYVTWSDDSPQLAVSEDASVPALHVARATYNNQINQTGWAFLEVHTAAGAADERQAYSAGYLEGFLTRDLVWLHWQNMLRNYCVNKTEVCTLIDDFVDKNEAYIARMVRDHADNNPYWYQMKLYYIQIEGLAMGYNEATADKFEKLSLRQIIWINMLGDLDEVKFAVSPPRPAGRGRLLFEFDQHCSGLVKLLPDHSELYIAHTTWNSYQSMLRIQKKYVLKYRVSPADQTIIPGHTMSFSSYPAFVQSTDDFYIISSGLVVAETTISNSNASLYTRVSPVGQVLTYARAVVANRLATDGRAWVRLFRRHNSGTYNNQWYILDYTKFSPASGGLPARLAPGLLWVLEQLPGTTESADLTEQLVRDTYFPSYNIPYFPRIFNTNGGQERVERFGDWFGYRTNPRAGIFSEKQKSIRNLRDMFATMRYNDYKHDPRARCAQCAPPYSATNAIAARCDLNPANGTYPFYALSHRPHGATDAKVTSSRLRKDYQFVAVSSPTYNISRGIPPFQWSRFDLGAKLPHVGHPDVWVFQPLLHAWDWG